MQDVSVQSVGRVLTGLVTVVTLALEFAKWRKGKKLAKTLAAVPPTPKPDALPSVDVAALSQRIDALDKGNRMARAVWELDDARAEVARLQRSELAWKVEEARTSEALMLARQKLERVQLERDQAIAELGQLKIALVPKE